MSCPTSLVDWRLAERAARAVDRRHRPGRRPAPVAAGRLRPRRRSRAACAEAIEPRAAYAGLGAVAGAAGARARSTGASGRERRSPTLAEAAAPLEAAASPSSPARARSARLARSARRRRGRRRGRASRSATPRVGCSASTTSRCSAPERPPRLLFVAENLAAARRELGVDRGPLPALGGAARDHSRDPVRARRWLARPPARAGRGAARGRRAAGSDSARPAALDAVLRDPRERRARLLRGELARALADPAQAATLDRLQAAMSVIEGHAEHVMDAGAAELGTGVAELRRRLDGAARGARRARRRDRPPAGHGPEAAPVRARQGVLRRGRRGRGARRACGGLGARRRAFPDLAELERPGALAGPGGASLSPHSA